MAVIDNQPELFGTIALPATACRTITAVAKDPTPMAALAGTRTAAREQAWRLGAAPPVVAAAHGDVSYELAGPEFESSGVFAQVSGGSRNAFVPTTTICCGRRVGTVEARVSW
jgi:hypothetical protein